MTTTEWYLAMGEAVRERNRAMSMVENWQRKVQAAEARIQELRAADEVTQGAVPTEQAQEQ